VTDPELLASLDNAAARLCGHHRPRIALLQNESIDAPVTWGINRHVVLVPARFEQLPAESVSAILCHEAAHVQARDFSLRILAEIARALIWYQPLMWIAWRQLREEQELACDDRVLAAGGSPSTYARLLMDWDGGPRRGNAAIAVGMAQRSCLRRRLYALLDRDLPRDEVSRAGALATWFLGLATALPLAAVSFIPVSFIQRSPTVLASAPAGIAAPSAIAPATPLQTAQVSAAGPQLPAAVKPEPPGAVLVLVLDKSASMEGQKIELLRAAAIAVIDRLRPQDQVGILTFDRSFQWTAEPTPAGSPLRRISGRFIWNRRKRRSVRVAPSKAHPPTAEPGARSVILD
jgi:hypothetical protein